MLLQLVNSLLLITHRMPFRYFGPSLVKPLLFGWIALLTAAAASFGEAPLLGKSSNESSQLLSSDWQESAAQRAMDAGLVVLAADIYTDLLRTEGFADEQYLRYRLQLASALIEQGRFTTARSVLKEVPEEQRSSAFHLRRAIALYGSGRSVNADNLAREMALIEPGELSAWDQSWYYLMRGLSAELGGEAVDIESVFRQAKNLTQSPSRKAYLDALLYREKLRRAPADEVLAAEIRRQLDNLEGPAAHAYAREYATVLYNLGRKEEAIAVLERELVNLSAGYTSREREQLHLLRATILGANSVSGRASLRDLIRRGQDRETMLLALQLLARADNAVGVGELLDFLKEMITRSEPHPLLGQFYYLRSQIALSRDDTEQAEQDAKQLLEQFPGLREIGNVYQLYAYTSLKRTPPQYRAAADFLLQLRNRTEDPARLGELNRLIGDCYYMNGDFADAVDFYRAAVARTSSESISGSLYLRLVTAELRAGKVESAVQSIDQADFSGGLPMMTRWQIEWNLSQALKANGEIERALKRVRLLLESVGDGNVPAALDLRLRWLEARLSMLSGDVEGAAQRVDEILARIDSFPDGLLDQEQKQLLISESLLLRAQMLLKLGDSEAGQQVLEELRGGYPKSGAAERSYLSQANHYAAIGDLERAQERLLYLATEYKDSGFAPQALFESAVIGERRGPDFYLESVRALNSLAEDYPEDELVFQARLKQGDLLRLMNDFSGARIVYENLISSFPEHPQHYVAELSRADCMLALARQDDGRLSDVELLLAKLIDVPNLPADFQAEAAYKLSFVMKKRGANYKARKVLTELVARMLLDTERAVRLNEAGRYWLSRGLLDLGELLEAAGESAEARRIYRTVLAYNLPGQNLAQSRADRLQVVESAP